MPTFFLLKFLDYFLIFQRTWLFYNIKIPFKMELIASLIIYDSTILLYKTTSHLVSKQNCTANSFNLQKISRLLHSAPTRFSYYFRYDLDWYRWKPWKNIVDQQLLVPPLALGRQNLASVHSSQPNFRAWCDVP